MLTLLYFASLRESLNCDQEQLSLPPHIKTLGELREHLSQRNDHWRQTLNTPGIFTAVDQVVSPDETPLTGQEEVAFFPPVTGG